jgi:16S rRNA (uracil1498-N3)-methyltransferase
LTFESWLDEPRAASMLMLVEPGAATEAEPLSSVREQPIPADAAIIVGPEGGWTDAEWSSARQRGVRLITLGHRTLRADAVPIAAISVLQFLWGDL